MVATGVCSMMATGVSLMPKSILVARGLMMATGVCLMPKSILVARGFMVATGVCLMPKSILVARGLMVATGVCLMPDVSVVALSYATEEVETEDDMVNAEMDPEDQVDVRDAIEDEGLQVVGWYHSHPTFQTYPSSVDIVNQNNYQRMYQNEESGRGADAPMDSGQPFIGAIVGPYHEDLPSTNASSFQWFHVHPAKGKGAEERRGIVGMDLVVDVLQAPSLEPSLPAAIKAVITCFSSHVSRHDMTEIWREFGSVSLTRLEKLQGRCPIEAVADRGRGSHLGAKAGPVQF
eukprot:gene2045-2736_t